MADNNLPSDSGVSRENPEKTRQYTILLVEDDQVLTNMYTKKLESEGYQVLNSVDGEGAFEVFLKENIDLVITDIMLPRVSGTEFLEKLRKTSKGKDLPVIVWSNLALEEEKNRALELGANEYIIKGSLTLDQIAQTVKKYLK